MRRSSNLHPPTEADASQGATGAPRTFPRRLRFYIMLLCGIDVADDDLKTLVDLLLRVGRADDLLAASTIELALEQGADAVDLTEASRTAVLGVLDDPGERLAPLRGQLLRRHRDRYPE